MAEHTMESCWYGHPQGWVKIIISELSKGAIQVLRNASILEIWLPTQPLVTLITLNRTSL